jgi:DNA-binding CsgD family transcriptional regulator
MERHVVIVYDSLSSFLAKYSIIVHYLRGRGFSITEQQLPCNEYSFVRSSHLLMICDQRLDVSYAETTIRNIGAKVNLLLTGEITVSEFNRLRRVGLNGLMRLAATPEQVYTVFSLLSEHSVLNTSLIVPTAILSKLSEREKQVLKLIAEGLTIKEIGNRFSISPNTVKIHFNAIRVKLGLPNKAQLIRFYLENCVPDR